MRETPYLTKTANRATLTPMKTNRFTAKALDAALPALNQTLAEIGDEYRFVAGGRNGYTAVDLATPEQSARFCCSRNLESGTPRECLAACHSYVSQASGRAAAREAAAKTGPQITLTEEQESAEGARIAAAFGLKRSRENPDRFTLADGYGTKTALGVYRVAFSLVHPRAV